MGNILSFFPWKPIVIPIKSRNLTILSISLLAYFLLIFSQKDNNMFHTGWHKWPGYGGWGIFPYGGLIMGLLLLLILGAVLYAVFRNRNNTKITPSSFEILKRRLARGEISKEEYRELLEKLKE